VTATPARGLRVVSLVPSITETLRSWGHDPIACTRFCEQPDLPVVGGTKNPDIDAIAALRPDVVMVDREENRREDADALARLGIEVLVTDVRSLDDVGSELDRMAARLGGVSRAPWSAPPTAPGPGRRAFIPIWRRPWMTIGPSTYGSTLLAVLGLANVYDDPDGPTYPGVTLEHVAERSPDVVIVPSEPYDFEAPHLAELARLAPVIEVDGRDLFWWGARTPDALERLRLAVR
jgi:ABC-type Fe3+-hydroxamate transport system substrate-binding protein